MIICNNDNSINQEISPFTDRVSELSVPNKKLCKLFYDAKGGGFDMEISLHHLLLSKKFPREKIHKLALEDLQHYPGFDDVTLVGFLSDMIYGIQDVDVENFKEFEYSDKRSCFVYFYSSPKGYQVLKAVRLDNLFTRGHFPNVFIDCTQLADESNSYNDDDHALSQEVIVNAPYLNKVKEIHDFMYSFEPKTCTTCKNRWFVTKSLTPGGVKLDILDPKKNKSCFQIDDTEGTECERCKNDSPPPGLPKLYSAENNMDFGPIFDEISALTPFEEMLLAKVSTLVSVCTLTSTGFLSYQGHFVSFFQNSVQWFNTIPRKASSACEFILIVRKGVPASSRRKAFKVSRVRIQRALLKLMKVHKQYGPEKVNIDWEYLERLPENDIPSDANVIEREMDDVIKVQKDLFDAWIDLCKPIGNKLLQYFLSQRVKPKDYFSHVCQSIITEYKIGGSITNLQLKDLLIKLGLINIEDQDNNDLILGELTHASIRVFF